MTPNAFACICAFSMACLAIAAPPEPLCGEWTGTRPPEGINNPNVQTWILTFRSDQSFALWLIEGKTSIAGLLPGLEGSYKATRTNVEFQIPNFPPVTVTYTIEGKSLKIGLSRLTTMIGCGKGVDAYVRTKEASELKPQKKQALLREGRYTLSVTIGANDNDPDLLRDTFGDSYDTVLTKPINGGIFPLHQLQGRNILQLPASQFGPPEFNGTTFKVFGAVAPKVNGDFSGEMVSPTTIKGTFKSRSTSLHGTFTLEMSPTGSANRR
jgi:hypothetical protein